MFRRLPFGSAPGFAPVCVDTNDPQTVRCGFEKRILSDLPVPKPASLAGLKQFVEHDLAGIPRVTKFSFEEWLDSCDGYNEQRKQQLREAHESLHGGLPSRRQCEHVDSFVKTESYDEYKHARLINSRSDAFKVFSGPLAKAMEAIVYDLEGDVKFIKHIPVKDRPAAILALKQPGWYYYTSDYTAYECSFDRCKMDILELPLYSHMLANYPAESSRFIKTLRGTNRMRTRSKIFCNIQARRMTGETVTSLGNGWSNRETVSYVVASKGGKVKGYVEGDDGIFATNVPLFDKDFEDLGFKVKLARVDDPCEASFCGLIFSEAGEIVRDPVHFLNKFGWTNSFINAKPKVMSELLRAKSLSVLYETPQCPLVGAIAHHALALTRDVRPRFVASFNHVIPPDEWEVPAFEPKLETRELFEKLFGVSIAEQLRLEARIAEGDLSELQNILRPSKDVGHYADRFLDVR